MRLSPSALTNADRERRRECYAAALDTIEDLNDIASLDTLGDRLKIAFSPYGVDHFIVAGLPNPHERFEKGVMLKHWSRDWFDVYTQEEFVKHDPVVRFCRSTTMPFDWTEATFDAEREPRTSELMNLAMDFGLARGFSVPVHGLSGLEACFSVSGAKPEFDVGAKAALHLIALYAFERVRRLAIRPGQVNPLTPREREVLTWAAAGKTHADIADILMVTERTVTAHTINATNKLGAANKTQAVVRAMQSKFINI